MNHITVTQRILPDLASVLFANQNWLGTGNYDDNYRFSVKRQPLETQVSR